MTEKLYDIDSHLKSFEATVLECLKCEDKFKVLLNKTAFFPEGGGQSADIGTIDGMEVRAASSTAALFALPPILSCLYLVERSIA